MFLRYYVELDLPTAQVEAALLDSPSSWLPALADGAIERAEPLFAEVGVDPAGLRVSKRVVVRLGEPVKFPSRLSFPMSWEPGGSLLPKLDAELELGKLGTGRTQLSISGRYEPPLGTVGRTVDRLALHRVAEATIKDFLDRVAAALESPELSTSSTGSRRPSNLQSCLLTARKHRSAAQSPDAAAGRFTGFAREFGVRVWAADMWIDPTPNWKPVARRR